VATTSFPGEDPRFPRWPIRDRLAWERATTGTLLDFLDDCPPLASWARGTQENARRVISALLRRLEPRHLIPTHGSLADVMTPDVLLQYVRELLPRQAPGTVEYSIFLIDGVLRVLAPDQDWEWIKSIIRRLGIRTRWQAPSPRPVIHSATAYALGLRIMREALSADGEVIDPSSCRTGLAIAFLAAAPMRIANFASLEIGRHLCRNGDRWIVRLAASETKTRRADVWPLAPVLGLYLDDYLRVVRPMLLRRARHSPATSRLWIGDSGRPIGDQVLRRTIGRVTGERLGIRLNPHAFRHCAATTFALELPHDALQSAALLGHASPQTTEQHYIVQQRQLVQEQYLELLQGRREPNRIPST
jgi:integrase/recombinase XerD